jgi:hypothetical protein
MFAKLRCIKINSIVLIALIIFLIFFSVKTHKKLEEDAVDLTKNQTTEVMR